MHEQGHDRDAFTFCVGATGRSTVEKRTCLPRPDQDVVNLIASVSIVRKPVFQISSMMLEARATHHEVIRRCFLSVVFFTVSILLSTLNVCNSESLYLSSGQRKKSQSMLRNIAMLKNTRGPLLFQKGFNYRGPQVLEHKCVRSFNLSSK